MACGVVFLICMMLTVALYSDAFQSYHLSRIAAKDIKAEEALSVKGWQTVCTSEEQTQDHRPVLSSDRYGYSYPKQRWGKMLLELHVSRRILAHMKYLWIQSINPFAGLMYITFKEVAYVIPFEDGQIITDNGTKASEFDYVRRSGEKKILCRKMMKLKRLRQRVEKL